MTLKQRLDALHFLGEYIAEDGAALEQAKQKAQAENPWFTREFIQLAIENIRTEFLAVDKLERWVENYQLPQENKAPKRVGIVTAGNIPLVGFHDFLCGFISGQHLLIKPSSKDAALLKHLVDVMGTNVAGVKEQVQFAEQLKGCDAYIATGSNNTSRYFEYYFRNYPSIIRKNRTSVAVLKGNETPETLEKLADDILLYFGLGCRNVSKLYVPANYDFVPLLAAFEKYRWMADHSKFKNNYDYQLSLHLLNSNYYMTNGIILLLEKPEFFSPISQVNYEFYEADPIPGLQAHYEETIQCIVGETQTPFGKSQQPALADYADGVDTLQFMKDL